MIRVDRNKKRIFFIFLLITLSMFGLIYRMYITQIRDARDFSKYHIDLIEKSVQQREQASELG